VGQPTLTGKCVIARAWTNRAVLDAALQTTGKLLSDFVAAAEQRD
jgi:hypothetical protein